MNNVKEITEGYFAIYNDVTDERLPGAFTTRSRAEDEARSIMLATFDHLEMSVVCEYKDEDGSHSFVVCSLSRVSGTGTKGHVRVTRPNPCFMPDGYRQIVDQVNQLR